MIVAFTLYKEDYEGPPKPGYGAQGRHSCFELG